MNQHSEKRIAFFIPTLASGGGERVVSTLSFAFSRLALCSLIVFEKNISYPFSGDIISLKVPLSQNLFLRAWRLWVRWWRFRQVLASLDFDAVISVGNAPNVMNLASNRARAVVRVDLPLSWSTPGFWGGTYRMAAKLLFRRAHVIVAVSRFIKHDVEKNFGVAPEQVRVIPNPVDTNHVVELAKEPLLAAFEALFQNPVVATMGRMTHQKGQWHLLRAFRLVKEQVPEARLVLLGQGELQNRLEELRRALGLDSSVEFLGWQDNPFAFLARAQVFVLPSLWEGLPDALLEAMACGLPVVSTDCRSGPREILAPRTDVLSQTKNVEEGEYGLLVPVCDGNWREGKEILAPQENMMAQTIARLLKNSSSRFALSEKSKERASHYDIQSILPQWEFLWNKSL